MQDVDTTLDPRNRGRPPLSARPQPQGFGKLAEKLLVDRHGPTAPHQTRRRIARQRAQVGQRVHGQLPRCPPGQPAIFGPRQIHRTPRPSPRRDRNKEQSQPPRIIRQQQRVTERYDIAPQIRLHPLPRHHRGRLRPSTIHAAPRKINGHIRRPLSAPCIPSRDQGAIGQLGQRCRVRLRVSARCIDLRRPEKSPCGGAIPCAGRSALHRKSRKGFGPLFPRHPPRRKSGQQSGHRQQRPPCSSAVHTISTGHSGSALRNARP